MISYGREYFSNNLYFYLKNRGENIDVYYSVNNTISEARSNDEVISVPVTEEKTLFRLVEKVMKGKKKFKKNDIKKLISKLGKDKKEEIDELIDYDGSILNSKIPIHDPKMSPTKTMDQTIYSTSQPGNPFLRGYRVYYGESVMREEDLTGAFGYDVVSGDTYEDCVDKMTQMEVENPEERCQAFGKSPKLDEKGQERLTEKEIKEAQRKKMIGMLEDLLVKKSSDKDINSKESKASSVLLKNLKSVKKMADKEGLSTTDLIKLLRNE